MSHIVAISGGKDSTALALRLAELEPMTPFRYVITPTGDELPEMLAHWERLEALLGQPLVRLTNGTLNGLIEIQHALPNWRQRWCTRILKIEPCLQYLREHQPAILYVGLRADEPERQGIYDEAVACRFPLREWGWTVADVWRYLREKGVRIPARTDCARCFGQRLSEWRRLWEEHPDLYAEAEAQEAMTGHTFRSPGRDRHPAALADLRRVFEQQLALPLESDEEFYTCEQQRPCRVCRL